MKSLSEAIQIKATEQYFPVVLTFEFAAQIKSPNVTIQTNLRSGAFFLAAENWQKQDKRA